MDELLKLSIEELEHILAVAPYSEMHQMAYAIKKNQHGTGSMYQVVEGNYHKLVKSQEELAHKVITSSYTTEIERADVVIESDEQVVEDSIVTTGIEKLVEDPTTEIEIEGAVEEHMSDEEGKEVNEDSIVSLKNEKISEVEAKVISFEKESKEEKEESKKTKPKSRQDDVLMESKQINLVGDVSAFIIPDKTKKKKKKKKKKEKDKKKKDKKKSKKKSGNKETEVTRHDSGTDPEEMSGLSDFSAWLLSQSKESHVNPLKESSKKKKKKKNLLTGRTDKKKKKGKDKKKKNKNLVSEPLADLLASQGHMDEAIDMYQNLSLIFPEKSAFFAAKIDKIQKDK